MGKKEEVGLVSEATARNFICHSGEGTLGEFYSNISMAPLLGRGNDPLPPDVLAACRSSATTAAAAQPPDCHKGSRSSSNLDRAAVGGPQ